MQGRAGISVKVKCDMDLAPRCASGLIASVEVWYAVLEAVT